MATWHSGFERPEVMAKITLQSNDGKSRKVDLEIAKLSVTIKTMLDDLGIDGEQEEVVPLPNVDSKILDKVIEWAKHHEDNPVVIKDEEAIDWTGLEWHRDFLEKVCIG